jgi:hypothetical protein
LIKISYNIENTFKNIDKKNMMATYQTTKSRKGKERETITPELAATPGRATRSSAPIHDTTHTLVTRGYELEGLRKSSRPGVRATSAPEWEPISTGLRMPGRMPGEDPIFTKLKRDIVKMSRQQSAGPSARPRPRSMAMTPIVRSNEEREQRSRIQSNVQAERSQLLEWLKHLDSVEEELERTMSRLRIEPLSPDMPSFDHRHITTSTEVGTIQPEPPLTVPVPRPGRTASVLRYESISTRASSVTDSENEVNELTAQPPDDLMPIMMQPAEIPSAQAYSAYASPVSVTAGYLLVSVLTSSASRPSVYVSLHESIVTPVVEEERQEAEREACM